jgi:hypothetical protein
MPPIAPAHAQIGECVENCGSKNEACVRGSELEELGTCLQEYFNCLLSCRPPSSAPLSDLVPLDDQGNPPQFQNPVRWCQRDGHGNLVVKVENQGDAFAPAFFTEVTFLPGGPTSEGGSGLSPSETRNDVFPIPAECFNPDCNFLIRVDSTDIVDEGVNGEGNNSAVGRCIG